MKGISLFTGAGGLDLGCEGAGFVTAAAVENEAVAQETLGTNRERFFPELTEDRIFGDIVELDPLRLLEAANAESGEIDLLHGGPPCTPFSKSGYWLAYKRAGKDPKASLLDCFVDVLEVVRPRAYLMENVYGLAYRNQNRPVLERFVRRVQAAGYSFDHKIVLAADHGVPQLRQRMFAVGIRSDLLDSPSALWKFGWPAATHSGPHETRSGWDPGLAPHVTSSEALAGMEPEDNPEESKEVVKGTFEEEFRAVPPGENYLFWTEKRGHPDPRFKWRSRYWTFLLKLHPDRPSPTIQAQPGPWVGPFHWDDRRLRVAEVKRLMTFPDEFVVCGSRREQQVQLGNAVPPKLGEVVAGAIRDCLDALESRPLAKAA
ncbi:MAG: DNA cytosine methyltransferase [Solirubrobacterales bacterium]